jgi:hypothetical protein
MVEQLGAVSLQFTSGVVRIDSSDLSIEESLLVGGWIDRHADRAKVLVGSDALASPLPRLGNFTPRKAPTLT